jgi:2-oxoglutarate dehydrogenase E2 component (dihydrolipoamide succinyltransferase)
VPATLEIRFPEDQQEGTEAVLSRWLKSPGDAVVAHEPLAEVETDKVVVEVPAPADGTLGEIRVKEGEPADPGAVLCTLLTSEETAAPESKPPGTDTPDEPPAAWKPGGDDSHRLSPAVRLRLLEHGLEPAQIPGTGRDGRITLRDVEAYLRKRQRSSGAGSVPEIEGAGSEIVPHDTMRRKIAANMVDSLLHTAPHVTAVFEADMSRVLRHRQVHKPGFERRGVPLTLTAYFVAAAVAAIRKVPQANSRWHEEHLEIFTDINIGIGTALGDAGLVVPVLHGAGDMDLEVIAAGLADLTGRARDGKLRPEDVRGGTFTLSNHGVSGSLFATPIVINQPQSAILGVGKLEKRIRVMEIDGEDVMAIRPMCYVSLTIDHRVLDGSQTNAWLTEFVSTLENWPEQTAIL